MVYFGSRFQRFPFIVDLLIDPVVRQNNTGKQHVDNETIHLLADRKQITEGALGQVQT